MLPKSADPEKAFRYLGNTAKLVLLIALLLTTGMK